MKIEMYQLMCYGTLMTRLKLCRKSHKCSWSRLILLSCGVCDGVEEFLMSGRDVFCRSIKNVWDDHVNDVLVRINPR